MFKFSDIKAGYLLRVKDERKNTEYNMTVVPATGYEPSVIYQLLFDLKSHPDGHLACCGGGEFWSLDYFKDNLEFTTGGFFCKVIAVYGYAPAKFLLDNSTECRELLWERQEAKAPAEEENTPVKKMTVEEISAALGYAVKVLTEEDK